MLTRDNITVGVFLGSRLAGSPPRIWTIEETIVPHDGEEIGILVRLETKFDWKNMNAVVVQVKFDTGSKKDWSIPKVIKKDDVIQLPYSTTLDTWAVCSSRNLLEWREAKFGFSICHFGEVKSRSKLLHRIVEDGVITVRLNRFLIGPNDARVPWTAVNHRTLQPTQSIPKILGIK